MAARSESCRVVGDEIAMAHIILHRSRGAMTKVNPGWNAWRAAKSVRK